MVCDFAAGRSGHMTLCDRAMLILGACATDLQRAYEVDHVAVIVGGDVIPSEPDLLEHAE